MKGVLPSIGSNMAGGDSASMIKPATSIAVDAFPGIIRFGIMLLDVC